MDYRATVPAVAAKAAVALAAGLSCGVLCLLLASVLISKSVISRDLSNAVPLIAVAVGSLTAAFLSAGILKKAYLLCGISGGVAFLTMLCLIALATGAAIDAFPLRLVICTVSGTVAGVLRNILSKR